MAKQCRAVSYLRGHLWENTFQGCHKAWAPRAARTIRPLKPERPAQVPGTRAASRVRDSAPGARGGTGPWAGFRTFTCSCALVRCPLSGPPPRREGLGAQHPRQEALVARLLRLTPEHMSGFCSVSGISETPLSHVCLEAGDRQAFSLSDREELHFFALSHDILLQAWPRTVAFIYPFGSPRVFIDSSLLYSLTGYRAPTRVLGAADRRKWPSQSSGDREGVTDRTWWSVTLDDVRR